MFTRMLCKCVVIFLCMVVLKNCYSYTFTQKEAKIRYVNPKYLTNVTALTFRKSRKTPYMTTINGTILTSWDKNITISIEIQNTRAKSEKYQIQFKLCDGLKMKWIIDWVNKYTDVTPACPLPANTYHLTNIEFPPKNIPLPITAAHGNYYILLTAFLTHNPNEILISIDGYILG